MKHAETDTLMFSQQQQKSCQRVTTIIF